METRGFTLLENAERSSEYSERQRDHFGKGAGNLNEDETGKTGQTQWAFENKRRAEGVAQTQNLHGVVPSTSQPTSQINQSQTTANPGKRPWWRVTLRDVWYPGGLWNCVVTWDSCLGIGATQSWAGKAFYFLGLFARVSFAGKAVWNELICYENGSPDCVSCVRSHTSLEPNLLLECQQNGSSQQGNILDSWDREGSQALVRLFSDGPVLRFKYLTTHHGRLLTSFCLVFH